MNVYSVRLIPSLKLKFCEFFGIASTMAVEQLQDRVDRLETKMDRLDGQIKRGKRKTYSDKGPELLKSNRRPAIAAVKTLEGMEVPLSVVTPELRVVEDRNEALVILIAPDENIRQVVQNFFGEDAKILETDSVEDLEEVEAEDCMAIFFDRTLLGDENSRPRLEQFSKNSPKTKMVGISSYLTLAFAESMPKGDDFATLLTRPLTSRALGSLFSASARRAIS